jgi:N-acetylneuraminic acid mutarotase
MNSSIRSRFSRPSPRTRIAAAARSVVEPLEDRRLMHAGHEHGTGLLGEYYNNINFTDLKLTRVDPVINTYWDYGSPAASIGKDTFSVRWTGQIEAPKSEAYTLIARTDDGVRLWLDGKLVINRFTDVPTIRDHASAPINLVAGQRYDVTIEYFENVGRAGAHLLWSSPTTPREVIPTASLFNGQPQPEPTIPTAPEDLFARPASATRIDVTWADRSNDETAFEVERSADGGVSFAPLATVGAGVIGHADQGLAPETRYVYRVRAVNGAGASGWSNVAEATTPAEPQQPPTPGGSVVRIDAAGDAGLTDSSGKFWAKDEFFTGGVADRNVFAVAGTPDDTLYATRRTGQFSCARPVENGNYTLRLLFADWNTSAGKRKFHVNVEGTRVLTNFDIVAEAGSKTALVKTFDVAITDGSLNMAFTNVVSNASLSAFELVPAGPVTAPLAPSGLTATGLSGGRVRLTWQDNSVNEEQFPVERSADGGATFVRVGTAGLDQTTFTDSGLDPTVTYVYRVRAANAAGASDASGTASAKPLADSGPITWSTGRAAPLTRAEAAGAVVNGKLYVLGGFYGNLNVTTQFDRYDPATNTWATMAAMPAPTTHALTAVDGNTIWVAGFFYNNGVTASRLVYTYDTLTNTWGSGPALPAARGAGAMAIAGRELHFWGGLTGSTSDAADHWRLDLDNPAAGWVVDTPLPEAINHHAGVALGGKLYSIGGMYDKQETSGNIATVRVYDPATRRWSTVRALPSARGHIGPSTFVRNGRIVIAGGSGNGVDLMREVVEYDPAGDTWTQLTPLPAARKSSVADYIDGKIIVTGGNQPGPSSTTWIGV